jgi:hypothetical protein
MTDKIKTITITDNIIITGNIATDSESTLLAAGFFVPLGMVEFGEAADSEPTLLAAGFSVPLGMAEFRSYDDVTRTLVDFSVIRITVGVIVVLQSSSFRASQCLFLYFGGPLQVKFGSVETLSEM